MKIISRTVSDMHPDLPAMGTRPLRTPQSTDRERHRISVAFWT